MFLSVNVGGSWRAIDQALEFLGSLPFGGVIFKVFFSEVLFGGQWRELKDPLLGVAVFTARSIALNQVKVKFFLHVVLIPWSCNLSSTRILLLLLS